MATFNLASEQWPGDFMQMKMIVGEVTMNNAGAGGYDAAGEALDLSAYFDTVVWGAIKIGGSAASEPYLWGATTGANVIPLITAAWTGPGFSGVLADVTPATDLSAATTVWIFFGY